MTVTGAGITLNPTSGCDGTTVNVTGTGFWPDSDVDLFYGPDAILSTGGTHGMARTNADGTLSASLTIRCGREGPCPIVARYFDFTAEAASALFTVIKANPQITLDPSSGATNTAVMVAGRGFPGNVSVRVFFDGDGDGVEDFYYVGQHILWPDAAMSLTTNPDGTFPPRVLTIPAVGTPGEYSIVAQTADADSPVVKTSATFTVVTVLPHIVLMPTSGRGRTLTIVEGCGFAPNTAGQVFFDINRDGVLSTGENLWPCTTDSQGVLSPVNLYVPPVAAGDYPVQADFPIGLPVETSATYTVTDPHITVNPTSGPAGTVVTINGSGFGKNVWGRAFFDTNRNNRYDPGEPSEEYVTTNSAGVLNPTTLTVPSGVAPGQYTIAVDCPIDYYSGIEASTTFTVTVGSQVSGTDLDFDACSGRRRDISGNQRRRPCARCPRRGVL